MIHMPIRTGALKLSFGNYEIPYHAWFIRVTGWKLV